MKTNRTSETNKKQKKKKKQKLGYPEKTSGQDAQVVSDGNPTGRRFEKGYLVEKPE